MLAWPKLRKHPEKPDLLPPLLFAPCLAASLPRKFAERANRQRRALPAGAKAKHLALAIRSLCSAVQHLLGAALRTDGLHLRSLLLLSQINSPHSHSTAFPLIPASDAI